MFDYDLGLCQVLQRGIHAIDDLLCVHADRMHSRNHDQNQKDQQHGVFADALAFFVPSDPRQQPRQE